MIDTPYKIILKSRELEYLKKTILTFINLFKTKSIEINYLIEKNKYYKFLIIVFDIYYLYQTELAANNMLDFNDMINLAKDNVSNLGYKYIIVDEYQDTSYTKYLFLRNLKQVNNSKLLVVGDDYQSIYRFTGCDLKMFLNFTRYFKYSKVLKLQNTYRNSQELINVSRKFILKNKYQMLKTLKSKKHIEKPIKILYGSNLSKLVSFELKKYSKILILGRNNNDINKYDIKLNDNIKYMTVHSSKGLECDSVIVINLIDDTLGFPSKIKNSKYLSPVDNALDNYPYEEERRLFYVALTRTKNEVFLLTSRNNPSIFIKEILKDSRKYIEILKL